MIKYYTRACNFYFGLFSKKKVKIVEVPISYFGRSYKEGKKIKLSDGIDAIYTLFKHRFF